MPMINPRVAQRVVISHRLSASPVPRNDLAAAMAPSAPQNPTACSTNPTSGIGPSANDAPYSQPPPPARNSLRDDDIAPARAAPQVPEQLELGQCRQRWGDIRGRVRQRGQGVAPVGHGAEQRAQARLD